MTRSTTVITPDLENLILREMVRDNPIHARCRKETLKIPGAQMQIGLIQGQFLAFLVLMQQAKLILELGTYTGYSAMVMANAMPPGGVLHTCDINAATTTQAQLFWAEAGVSYRIIPHLLPALECLNLFLQSTDAGRFDLIFIDADKKKYKQYYESSLLLLKRGGIIIVDNIFWSGKIVDTKTQDKSTIAIREFNQFVRNDKRVDISVVTVGDGLLMIRKR